MTEIEQLAELLKKHWVEMTYQEVDDFEFIEENSLGSGRWMEHMEVITRGPSGTHYRWKYESGLTENQESEGPAEYGEPDIEIVKPVKEIIEVTKWVKAG